jgi:hypothetical protein
MKMGRRPRCSSVTYQSRYAPSSRLAGGPFLIATKAKLFMGQDTSRLLKNTMMENLERVSPAEIGGALLMVWLLAGLPNLRTWQRWRVEPVRRPKPLTLQMPKGLSYR